MRHLEFIFGSVSLVTTAALSAQPGGAGTWTGVWEGQLDGQPSVTLTLAEDSGELGGTLVLNIISAEEGQPHVVAREPHVLVQPRVDGNKLSFEVRRIDKSSDPMNFTVVLTHEGKAQIHCLNCGAEAPTVTLVKSN